MDYILFIYVCCIYSILFVQFNCQPAQVSISTTFHFQRSIMMFKSNIFLCLQVLFYEQCKANLCTNQLIACMGDLIILRQNEARDYENTRLQFCLRRIRGLQDEEKANYSTQLAQHFLSCTRLSCLITFAHNLSTACKHLLVNTLQCSHYSVATTRKCITVLSVCLQVHLTNAKMHAFHKCSTCALYAKML